MSDDAWMMGTRLELLAMQEELERVSFHGPRFKAWLAYRIDWLKKELDKGMREKLAASGIGDLRGTDFLGATGLCVCTVRGPRSIDGYCVMCGLLRP